ncbi:hypothetical protein RsoPWF2_12 [Ralstonia phage vRsoP-WF2]|nr:hypothetical protein RsoPWF2_12 [Ralstonia phage vRsoP-WF2]UHX60303.1 hypothetical protein RsoPWM2_12 [Ralstonia phage vRsoP-WM2]UHX60355.1 hypothetical protein RsoPWR2_12 [Ralstonia phage vRsoP-WR2]
MKPADGQPKRFKLHTKYPHNRSEGLTHRTNKGTALQVLPKR